jgi:hypothetical protein
MLNARGPSALTEQPMLLAGGSGSIGRMAALRTLVSVYLIVRFPLAALILLALVLAS